MVFKRDGKVEEFFSVCCYITGEKAEKGISRK
jgi:hypothetical protein